MGQKLILPINKCKLTASWKTDSYKNKFGFAHYGVDMVTANGSFTLYASGDGTVAAVGVDNIVGNVVAVAYKDACNSKTGKSADVVFRYFHLAKVSVKDGQRVDKDTVLGLYGNTGQFSTGAHLHLEADTDTRNPIFSPTLKSGSFIKGTSAGANDKTMTNPLEWLHCNAAAPDYQCYTTANDVYIRAEDKVIPTASDTPAPKPDPEWPSEIERLRAENDKLVRKVAGLHSQISELEGVIRQVHKMTACDI